MKPLPSLPPHRATGPAAAIFTLVLLLAGILVGRYVRLTPVAASGSAEQVDRLFHTMLGIGAAIFFLVEGMLLYSVFRFRRRQADASDGLPIHGSERLEVAWTLVPALIVLWLGVYSYQIFAAMETPRQDKMVVEVIAYQFDWEFHYPDMGITSQDLHVPEGKMIRLKITSRDVIHSFWVPALRVKQDAIPGRQTELYFLPNASGAYRVVCAELCGVGHARMGLLRSLVVQSQSDFDAWVAEQQAQAGQPPAPGELFNRYGCVACHTLTSTGATGQVGPNLDGIGTRAGTRVAGLSAEEYIRASILTPNAYVVEGFPGNVMPQDFGARMPEADLEALVNFLLQER